MDKISLTSAEGNLHIVCWTFWVIAWRPVTSPVGQRNVASFEKSEATLERVVDCHLARPCHARVPYHIGVACRPHVQQSLCHVSFHGQSFEFRDYLPHNQKKVIKSKGSLPP